MKTVYIYTLEHPINHEIRYVGKTINLKARFNNHTRTDRKNTTRCSNWIKGLQRDNLKPIMKIIEEATEATWSDAEMYWIAQLRQWGFNLTNHHEGGINGKYDKNTKEKQRKSNTGKHHNEKTKKLLSEIAIKAHKNGSHPHFFGKQTQEFIDKRIGNRIENIKKGKQQVNSTKIVAINTETKEEIVFNSIAQAALVLNLKYNRVSDASRGQLGRFKNRHNYKQFAFYRLE